MGLFGTGSYKVMSIWPPRLLQLCCGGQINVKTNPKQGRRPHLEPRRNTANSIITVHTCGSGLGLTAVELIRIMHVFAVYRCFGGVNAVRVPPRHVYSLFRGLLASECVQISFCGPLRGPIFVGGRCLLRVG